MYDSLSTPTGVFGLFDEKKNETMTRTFFLQKYFFCLLLYTTGKVMWTQTDVPVCVCVLHVSIQATLV